MAQREKDAAIGVFDSGMGGLTAVRAMRKILPHENIVYFGDTARIPYGSRSEKTILRYAREDADFLRQYQVKMIIAACGTVSSVVGDAPFITDMPFTGVVLPASRAAAEATQNGRVGVIGTSATVKSRSYEKALYKLNPSIEVTAVACPLFVHLVENGYTDFHNHVTRLVAQEYLTPLKDADVDVLILGCTHYPVIRDIIADIMGDAVTLISSGEQAARYARECLEKEGLLSTRTAEGDAVYYVSDDTDQFYENAARFLGTRDNLHVFQASAGTRGIRW